MPISLRGESPYDVIFFKNYHNLSFKTDTQSKPIAFCFFEGVIDTEGANDDVTYV